MILMNIMMTYKNCDLSDASRDISLEAKSKKSRILIMVNEYYGIEVVHKYYGKGKVIAVAGKNNERRIIVDFRGKKEYLLYPDVFIRGVMKTKDSMILKEVNDMRKINKSKRYKHKRLKKMKKHELVETKSKVSNNRETVQKNEIQVRNLQVHSLCSDEFIKTIFVINGGVPCRIKHHSVFDVAAVVKSISTSNDCTIAVSYCSECDKYFIHEESLKLYEKKFGQLLFQRDYSHYLKLMDDSKRFASYSQYSKLKSFGYSVSNDSISDTQREFLLKSIIRTGMITSSDVKKHLEFLIKERSTRNPKASVKWKKDLLFINAMSIEDAPRVRGILK